MRCWSLIRALILPWFRDYDWLQCAAMVLLYIQIGCALVGSLGAQFNGVLLINLAIALFALVAIESCSQSLGRAYGWLLFCAILLDVCWFILFTRDIWNISTEEEDYGVLVIFSIRLTLAMQMIGFAVRLLSSILWIQIYKLGVSHGSARESDLLYLRNSFLNPAVMMQSSDSDDVGAASIYDPPYFSSLFEDAQNTKNLHVLISSP